MIHKAAKPKTELARRLCAARLALGFEQRKQFALHIGVHPGTLGKYEIGLSEPHASFLALYKTQCGISLDWLVTGKGDMYDHNGRKSPPLAESDINAAYLRRALHIVEKALADSRLTTQKKADLVQLVYALVKTGRDTEIVERLIEILRMD